MFGTSITIIADGDFIPTARRRVAEFAAKEGFTPVEFKDCDTYQKATKWLLGTEITRFSVKLRENPGTVTITVIAGNGTFPPINGLSSPCAGMYAYITVTDDDGIERKVSLEEYVYSLIISAYKDYAGQKLDSTMKVILSYDEISDLIYRFSRKEARCEYDGTPSGVKIICHHIPIYLSVKELTGDSVTLRHRIWQDVGTTSKLKAFLKSVVQEAVDRHIAKHLQHPSVRMNEDGTVTVSLSGIDSLKGFLKVAELKSLEFNEDGAAVTFVGN